MITYNNIPCPVLKFEEPDSYLIIYKEEQKLIYESSLGYGEILEDEESGIFTYKINNIIHREGGPAIIYDDGTKQWLQNGKRHRLNGPAIEYSDGYRTYWIEGKQHSEEKYWKELRKNYRK